MPETLARRCPQCGAPVPIQGAAPYVRCDHCGSSSFVDLSEALLHQAIQPVVSRSRVPGLVRASARDAGHSDVQLMELDLVYHPVWELEAEGGVRIHVSARPGADGHLAQVDLPGGERRFIDPDESGLDITWLEPEVAPEAVPEIATRVTGRPVRPRAIRLVHCPVYECEVRVGSETAVAHIDGVSGALRRAGWGERPTYRNRNRAWMVMAAMLVAAAAVPFPWAVPAVIGLGALGAWSLGRPTAMEGRS